MVTRSSTTIPWMSTASPGKMERAATRAEKVEKAAKAARLAKEANLPKEMARTARIMVAESRRSMFIATGARSGATKKWTAGAKQTQRAKIRAKAAKAVKVARAPATSKMGNKVLQAA